MLKPILIMSCLVFACGKNEKKEPQAPDEDLKGKALEKRQLYLSLQDQVLNADGYAHDKCDSLGFTSLCKAAGGCDRADIFASEDNGRWYRSPEKDCFDKGESKSDFSKDMALMLFIYIHQLSETEKVKAAEAITRFRDYVKANDHIMGRPTDNAEGLSRVVMSPGLILTMERLYGKLTGASALEAERDILPIINKGFQAHLDVLGIWLDGQLTGKINDAEKTILKKQAERQPRNALFEAAWSLYRDGNQTRTLELLNDESLFPSDRLPGSIDRCEEYVFQRDDGSDWQPCEEAETHDAVDYLMALYIAGF